MELVVFVRKIREDTVEGLPLKEGRRRYPPGREREEGEGGGGRGRGVYCWNLLA